MIDAAPRSWALSAFRHRDFRLMWAGHAASNVGIWVQTYALGWYVVQLAAHAGRPELAPLYVGLLGLARAVPGLGLGLVAGVAADRYDRRAVLAATQVAAALTTGLLALITSFGTAGLPVILALQLVISVAFAFEVPARQAMVTQVVPPRDVMSAIGMNSVAFNGAAVAGPLLGGLLIGQIGVPGLLAVHAASYVGILLALTFVRPLPHERAPDDLSMIASIREGVRYVASEPILAWVVALAVVVAMFGRPYLQLLPAVAQDLGLGALELSWLLAACGVGAVTGAIATASIGAVRRRGVVLVASAIAVGLLIASVGVQRTLVGALVALAVASLATQLFLGLANTMLQTRTPPWLRGRTMSVHASVMLGILPLGTMLLGTAGSAIGVLNAILVGGIAVIGAALYAAARAGVVRRYEWAEIDQAAAGRQA